MSPRQIIIRSIANALYLLRRRSITQANIQFIICTGTAGKTTTRFLLAHALEHLNHTVVSTRAGYSNELGVILATLGIVDTSLRTRHTWRRICFGTPPKNALVCIELGADIYRDINWFLKRFQPHSVVLTAIDTRSWARQYEHISEERVRLLTAVPPKGAIFYESGNAAAETMLKKASPVASVLCISRATLPPQTHQSLFTPQQTALALAAALVGHITRTEIGNIQTLLMDQLTFPHERLVCSRTANGAILIADTYKAVPLCTDWFMRMALTAPGHKKFLLLSALRPPPRKNKAYYRSLSKELQKFQGVFFTGNRAIFRLLATYVPHIHYVASSKHYADMARKILDISDSRDAVFIKGASRYRLTEIQNLLENNTAHT